MRRMCMLVRDPRFSNNYEFAFSHQFDNPALALAEFDGAYELYHWWPSHDGSPLNSLCPRAENSLGGKKAAQSS
jgi:hypothetical protein